VKGLSQVTIGFLGEGKQPRIASADQRMAALATSIAGVVRF
jgi:hypothetical protein